MPHTKRLEMRTLAEQNYVEGELTSTNVLILSTHTQGTPDSDKLMTYASPHHRKQYELEVNCIDLIKGGHVRFEMWKNITRAQVDGKTVPLKRIYEGYH